MNDTHRRWTSSPLPAVTIPAAVSAELARTLRDDAERAGYARYALLDRGSYDVLELGERCAPAFDAILPALVGVAEGATGRPLALATSRVLRLRAGDYLLVRHDRVPEVPTVELVVDLSPAPVPGAEVHWRHRGQVYFAFPSTPGALALVERGPTVLSNHTYLSRRTDADCVRLVALLHEPAP